MDKVLVSFDVASMYTNIPRAVFWRYVDDTFVVIKRDDVNSFHDYLNSLNPYIKFSMEIESISGTLPFLDCITHKSGGKLKTTIYQKPTETGTVLNYPSAHPKSVTPVLSHLCLAESERYAQKRSTERQLKSRLPTDFKKPSNEWISTAVIPYKAGTSEVIRRLLKSANIRVAFQKLSPQAVGIASMLYSVTVVHRPNKGILPTYPVNGFCGLLAIGSTRAKLLPGCPSIDRNGRDAWIEFGPRNFRSDFIFIHLNVLREYLAQDLKLTGLTFEWDLERVIDDWVFMCFFVGNDFLPHLPSLEIREGAIDRLIEIYKSAVQTTGGWLTHSGKVHMDRVQLIMVELGKMEDEIFKNRRQSELNFRKRKRDNQSRDSSPSPQRMGQRPSWNTAPRGGILEPVPLGGRYGVAHPQGRYRGPSVSAAEIHQARQYHSNGSHNVDWVDRNLNNLEAATAMKAMLRPRRPGEKSTQGGPEGSALTSADDGPSPSRKPRLSIEQKRGLLGGVGADAVMKSLPKDSDYDQDDVADANDEVRLWEDGWRTRYYQSKFGVDPADAPEFCIQVGKEYAKGLCWVLAYYYQGCASWDWYFPYHYAPFASDFIGIDQLDPGFDKVKTQPFRPLEQLMGVFPADSRSHVPPAWQTLMTDPDSPIIDFYPTDFKVDLNGKRYLWMGVALLPFVDEVRLLKALDERRHLLSDEEVARNIRGPDRLFCRDTHPLASALEALYSKNETDLNTNSGKLVPNSASVLDPRLTHGVSGHVWPDRQYAYLPGTRVPSGVPALLPDLKTSHTVSVCYADPSYPDGFIFPAELLKSVKLPPPTHLQPPQRGRGRGGSFRGGNNERMGRFNSHSALSYYARDSSSDRESSDRSGGNNSPSPMNRMIRHALPDNSRTGHFSRGMPPRMGSRPHSQPRHAASFPTALNQIAYGLSYRGRKPFQGRLHVIRVHIIEFIIHIPIRCVIRPGLRNLAVSQPSCNLRVERQLGTERVLQLNDIRNSLKLVVLEGLDNTIHQDSTRCPSDQLYAHLGLSNLTVSQPSCSLRVAWQLATERVSQLNGARYATVERFFYTVTSPPVCARRTGFITSYRRYDSRGDRVTYQVSWKTQLNGIKRIEKFRREVRRSLLGYRLGLFTSFTTVALACSEAKRSHRTSDAQRPHPVKVKDIHSYETEISEFISDCFVRQKQFGPDALIPRVYRLLHPFSIFDPSCFSIQFNTATRVIQAKFAYLRIHSSGNHSNN
ncbi:5'-3' exoribonuclease 2 [Clonorchis sinensis]|uniref:5'-3' exoribonuclease 2 n=1 Tax=Clonorchis sinensis TaxID=79923 RepID=G7YGL1_CLOSI|nr:5'-3' exoribonuclease 2 [Clonorchis sinensis]